MQSSDAELKPSPFQELRPEGESQQVEFVNAPSANILTVVAILVLAILSWASQKASKVAQPEPTIPDKRAA